MRYICDPQVIPTVVPHESADIEAAAHAAAQYSTWLHVDIDDGLFTPSTSWPYQAPGALSALDVLTLPHTISLEAHLMVASPREVALALAKSGLARITMHVEGFEKPEQALAVLRETKGAGAKEVGLALKLDTPLSKLFECIGVCDFVHVMSVENIGEQGQPFDEHALSRVEEIHAEYPDLMVAVDGGISEATVEGLVRAGANRLLVGRALAQNANPARAYADMVERAMRGCAPLLTGETPVAA